MEGTKFLAYEITWMEVASRMNNSRTFGPDQEEEALELYKYLTYQQDVLYNIGALMIQGVVDENHKWLLVPKS